MSTNTSKPAENAKQRLAAAKRAVYRDAIIAAAEKVFAEGGYETAKVNAIAHKAGLSLATLYATFPTKWDMYRALQKDRLDALMQQVGKAVVTATDPFDRLEKGITGYLRFHMEHPDYLRGQLRERVPWGTTDDLRTPEQTQAWDAGLKLMIASFEQGAAAGLFVADDPELCARTATAMSQVRLSLWIDRGMNSPPAEVATAAMLQLVRTFARSCHVEALSERVRSAAAADVEHSRV